MSRTPIKDSSYRIIGYIEDMPGGKQKAIDAAYRILGYYDPKTNKTQDASYRIIANGNVLSGLIFNKH